MTGVGFSAYRVYGWLHPPSLVVYKETIILCIFKIRFNRSNFTSKGMFSLTPSSEARTPRGIVIINLARRPDRLRSLLNLIENSDLSEVPVYRLAAHDGTAIEYHDGLLTEDAKLELEDLKRTRVRNFHGQLSLGAIGCYLSHVDVWRFVIDNAGDDQDTPFLILEDDARLPKRITADLQKGWELGARQSGDKPFIVLAHVICLANCARNPDGLLTPERYWSAQSYLMNPKAAKALLDAGMFPIDVQVDFQMQYYRNAGILNIYAYDVIKNYTGDTDIQVNIRPNAPLDRFRVFSTTSAAK